MDNFQRVALVTTFGLIGLAGCGDNSLNEEQMQERTFETYRTINSTLIDLNPYFLLADTSISALYLLNAQEGTKEGACSLGGEFTATLNGNSLHMEFNNCSTESLSRINGVLILELAELEQQEYLLALNSRIYSENISWAESRYEISSLRYDFDAELIQTITGTHSTLTTLNFSENTQVVSSNAKGIAELSNMSYQRELDYETGIFSIAYEGKITRFDDKEVSVFITTPEPIEAIRGRSVNGAFLIDDGKIHINASLSKSFTSYYSFDIETDFNEGGVYRSASPWPVAFADEPEILTFTSRKGDLGKYSSSFWDEDLSVKDRLFYRHLSPNDAHLQPSEEGAAQLGFISLAILPIFDNLGQFTVLIFEEETGIELNTELYTVSLDSIWVTISFDSSLSFDTYYSIKLTDDNGREIINRTVN